MVLGFRGFTLQGVQVLGSDLTEVDRLRLWEGFHERRRCSRDTHPESYITKYTSIRRLGFMGLTVQGVEFPGSGLTKVKRAGGKGRGGAREAREARERQQVTSPSSRGAAIERERQEITGYG